MKPLEGTLAIDLTRVLAGPFCTMLMGDMGAEVIKIEAPGKGDDTRSFGPPFLKGESTYFMSINRNKRSVTLDFRRERGKEILWRLIEKGDVLIENFKPGSLDRAGFSWERCRERNKRLVYASISGFGAGGDAGLAGKPGYDLVIQGLSGMMDITGFPDGPPCKVGNSIADLVAGMYGFQGILLALLARERTGRGQRVDISMLDSMVSLLTYQAGMCMNAGKVPARMGNQHPTIAPYETFETSDGYMNIAVGNDRFWGLFCQALKRPDLAEDQRFATNEKRVMNRQALLEILNPILRGGETRFWIEAFEKYGVPCGPILNVEETLGHPRIVERGMVKEMGHRITGSVKVLGIPISLSDTEGGVTLPPPPLGGDTDAVLIEHLGLSDRDIRDLRREGII